MQRIIEEFIEKRKEAQENLKKTLNELGISVKKSFLSKNRKSIIDEKFSQLSVDIDNLILSYSREWDAYSNNHMTGVLKSIETKISNIEADYSNAKHLQNNFLKLEKGLSNLIENIEEKGKDKIEELKNFKEELSPFQYSDFEQRFRGEEAKIRKKLEKHYKYFENSDNILDIGCGRGEFIEILKKNDKNAVGIDISQSMLDSAKQKGLDCKKYDVLAYLKQQEDMSIGGIFSSQVIEHFQPEYLRQVLTEAFRTMKKGAVIVLETINPLSIFALSRIFFLDVTHQKPLHPEFMRYLLESSGFFDVEIIYSEGDLNNEKLEAISPENKIAREFNTNIDKLNSMLYSSLEYTVKGIKK